MMTIKTERRRVFSRANTKKNEGKCDVRSKILPFLSLTPPTVASPLLLPCYTPEHTFFGIYDDNVITNTIIK